MIKWPSASQSGSVEIDVSQANRPRGGILFQLENSPLVGRRSFRAEKEGNDIPCKPWREAVEWARIGARSLLPLDLLLCLLRFCLAETMDSITKRDGMKGNWPLPLHFLGTFLFCHICCLLFNLRFHRRNFPISAC